jgi:hypothetical protein
VFVRSNPRGIAGVAADVNAAVTQLAAIGAPKGTLACWDMETAADALYIAGVYAGLAAAGYRLIVYGSQSDVMGNDVPDGLYFGADWTGVAHMARGDVMTQWVSFAGYDVDLAQSSLPFWDTRAMPSKPPAMPTFPATAPVRAWTTQGLDSLAQLASAHGVSPAIILRMTAENGPAREFSPAVASWLDTHFAQVTEPVPADLVLYLPSQD